MFVPDGGRYVATTRAQGGWDPTTANGGVMLALLGHVLDGVPTLVPMSLARFTADLVRPVPLGQPIEVVPHIRREGKKIQVVDLQAFVGEVEYARATALRLREADMTDLPGLPASTTDARPAVGVPGPEMCERITPREANHAGFLEVVDMRPAHLDGRHRGTWLRLDGDVVAGEPLRPTSRLTFCFDYANLVGVPMEGFPVQLINPDVTAHVLRPPGDDWVVITGDTRFEPGLGRGMSLASFSDSQGVFAVTSIAQLIQPMPT